MKKLLLILVLVLALAVAGLIVFIATFDADRYRPLVVQQITSALGRPVQLQRLALSWRGGLAIQLQGVAVEPVLRVDSLDAQVQLLPLLRKAIQVASITLTRPKIELVRDAQGQMDLLGVAAVAAPAAASGSFDSSRQGGTRSGFRPATGGAQQASVGPAAVSFRIASLRIEDGALHYVDASRTPAIELWVKQIDATISDIAPGMPMRLDVRAALAADAQNLTLNGRVTLPDSASEGMIDALAFSLNKLRVDQITPQVATGQPQLHGVLSFEFEGRVPTLVAPQVLQAVAGQGTLKVDEPRIANLNILREVFQRFSMIPSLIESLQARLPATYQAKLAATDTILAPMNLPVRLQDGVLWCDEVQMSTDTFRLAGQGSVGLDQTLTFRTRLYLEPELSAAMIQSVHELRGLANANGELEIPVAISGRAPQVAVMPDLNYVASKVIATTAVDLLEAFLKPEQESQDAPQGQEGQAPSQTHAPAPEDLLGQFLQRALQKSQ